ncbi:pyridoxal phosphate-dependent aminotransferase [Clostridium chauvoei]|uniref:Aminotransferase n=2 Tax=Clostridium chauvoei TaxID=46867 RepID=S6FKP8_9CLOT|nr:pyridoxal phosphate-dependent aminotransferase [Clostridium chauvoei]ATD54601.1 aspartate aminotransferase [Clostridium chauvoei]ATD57718.1 aspartate aminotransferase [Clostridium chauvoei]MBX7281012.1 pyridoxal phosphate-dependent aminotransferase [Clostridium chauvoei]MBX7283487.1 pyridoxal phosphate-dependent aminotransferase [Clostridium chauvoei]MBX7286101.1 pyridoxal phosphate-dependent aminotransferase [Clostridium chauvoei]
MKLSKKAQEINPSITLAITAKAKELKALGVDVVSFGAGEPDFNTPKNIMDAAIKAMEEGKTKYTPTNGVIELREAICDKFQRDNGLKYDPSQIVVSTGAKQSLANTFMAILNVGDEVIIPTPYWVSYPELVKLAGGIPVFVQNKEESNYKYTLEALNEVVTEKTKAIVLNSPNNPTGTIYTKDELIQIAEFAKKNNLMIISDEIYEKLIYDNETHISIASLSQDAYERTIVINGLSKSYAMTGWRIGYSASSQKIAKLMSAIQSHMTSNINSISQYAAIEALNGTQETIKDMVIEFEKRRNYMVNRISEIENISIIKPSGAFYVMVNVKECYGKKVNGKIISNSLDFASEILEIEKVAVIPGIAFGLDDYIRLSYATSMEIIKEGLDRIETFIKKCK